MCGLTQEGYFVPTLCGLFQKGILDGLGLSGSIFIQYMYMDQPRKGILYSVLTHLGGHFVQCVEC